VLRGLIPGADTADPVLAPAPDAASVLVPVDACAGVRLTCTPADCFWGPVVTSIPSSPLSSCSTCSVVRSVMPVIIRILKRLSVLLSLVSVDKTRITAMIINPSPVKISQYYLFAKIFLLTFY
jgi:hypothetical protein